MIVRRLLLFQEKVRGFASMYYPHSRFGLVLRYGDNVLISSNTIRLTNISM
jgi:hypothetical protein